jgi:NAD dependent epimerase/dehydratase family enzyme
MVFSIPKKLLTTAMGEMSTVLTNSSRVSSDKITGLGFQFKYPNLGEALKNLIG